MPQVGIDSEKTSQKCLAYDREMTHDLMGV